jgi:mannose-6-phosphate isomerase
VTRGGFSMPTTPGPVELAPNCPPRPYLGGAGIAALRGVPQAGDRFPEDFVASTTEVFTGGGVGLSRLPDGTLLRDAIAADPVGYLGREHVARFGASTELLVKLLDTGERLFVHLHPDQDFAERHLDLAHGKTEAWIVTAVRPVAGAPETTGSGSLATGAAYLGFTRDVGADEVAAWVDGQRVPEMLAAMHRVDLRPGSTLFVPAGLPHSIGPGITLVELQEPTDLSILMEYDGFPGLSAADAFLGLDPADALSALDRRGWAPEDIAALTAGRPDASTAAGVTRLLPESADPFFRAERLDGAAAPILAPGFSVLVVLDGDGVLDWAGGSLPLRRGATILVPFGAGEVTVRGAVTLIRCRPPAAANGPEEERR